MNPVKSAGVSVRLACPGDAGGIERFLERVDGDFPVPLTERVDLTEYVSKLMGEGFALVAEEAGNVKGVAAGYANDSRARAAYLSVIAVDGAARGAGVGSLLLNAFELEAAGRGMHLVSLHTNVENSASRAMYGRCGYACEEGDRGGMTVSYSKRIVWLTPERPNILLSSAGRRTYLVEWFREALGGRGLVHASNSDPAATSLAAADRGVVTPLIYSEAYVPFMLDYCERERIGAIVPLFDVDIPVLAAHRAEFEAIGCFPVVAPVDFAKVCSDKLSTSELLASAGIPHPCTYVGAYGFMDAVGRGEASFPAFIKPRWGMGSIGLAEASDEEELRVLCGIVERKVRDSYLRFESSADEPGRSVIVQPRIGATEYGMDVYCDLSGRYRGCVVRRKVAMRAGETDVAEVVDADARFEGLARSLAGLSRHPGCMDVDVFDAGGELMVLEMNARFGGGYPFSHAAGVDMPRALVSWLRGEEYDSGALAVKTPGTYMKDMTIVRADRGTGC